MDNGLSIVIAVHDQAYHIEQNLEQFLTQTCEAPYEVIVVDDSSSDNTPDLLTQLKTKYPQLYSTFLPKSVVYTPSRLQLALTIGAKAAKYPWVVLADINRPPVNAEWLKGLQEQATGRNEAVIAYSNRKQDTIYYQTWQTLEEAAPLLRKAERRSGRGHQGKWNKFRRGLYDAVAVPRQQVHDAIRLFDRKISGGSLWGLRWNVWWMNMMNRA